jgi:hypothetical protein
MDEVELDLAVKEYLTKNNPYICILTPCYGGNCNANYVRCLLATFELCKKYNIKIKVEFCSGDSLISRARNNLIALGMNQKDITHLLFIDSDIMWKPVEVIKLLLADKFLVGGTYPIKKYFWNKIADNYSTNTFIRDKIEIKNNNNINISNESMIKNNLLKYNFNLFSNEFNLDGNLLKVGHIATGFMMMKRELIDEMIIKFPETKYSDDIGFLNESENKYAYALFDCGVVNGHYYSEDWLFCHRWLGIGGDVYLDITINLTHTGSEDFEGSYLNTIIH